MKIDGMTEGKAVPSRPPITRLVWSGLTRTKGDEKISVTKGMNYAAYKNSKIIDHSIDDLSGYNGEFIDRSSFS
jgi:hypothetical protein